MIGIGRQKRRAALVGTGHRGAGLWGIETVAGYRDQVDLVALCDLNRLRAERAREAIGLDVPVYTDLDAMLAEIRPDTVIVCTTDVDHDVVIIRALESGADVITEKPMAISAEKCRRILDAEARTGRRVDVTFNYRYAPTSRTIKELLVSGAIGEVTAVDFHWYLDNRHGADYFRRWHAYERNSGSLFVHKATHHFDLINWYLDSEPEQVFAQGSLRHYGRNGPFRGERCKTCSYQSECSYYFDLASSPWLDSLYEAPSHEDGYVRDACVFREDIDIPDTMSALIRYANGAQVTYSLAAYLPVEGHAIAFNGRKGRIEIRQFEKQPWETPSYDEIVLIPSSGGVERIRVPHEPGGHFGGDPKLQDMLFKPDMPDPLGQRAGSRAGALSVLCGVAALESLKTNRAVTIASLLEGTN